MPQLTPDTKRLLPEVFRRVAVPYSGAFSASGRSALSHIVSTALGGAPAAPKHAVTIRLAAIEGHPTGRRSQESHLDEFAVAFGFLEDAGTTFIPGKFALAMHFLHHAPSSGGHVNIERGERAIWLYALLERHGDCLLPFLELSSGGEANVVPFIRRIQDALNFKIQRLKTSQLPRNASFHEALSALTRMAVAWGAAPAQARPSLRRPKGGKLDTNTLAGYLSRTRAYAAGTELIDGAGRNSTGADLLLREWRVKGSGLDVLEIPPSAEAIHDAFSIDPLRYAAVFRPPVSAGVFESLIYSLVLPARDAQPWEDAEMAGILAAAVETLAEPLSNSARVDSVRLALFAYFAAVGRPIRLDSQQTAEGVDTDYNANAVVQLGLSNPRLFHLGHARTGRRFWSITLLRR